MVGSNINNNKQVDPYGVTSKTTSQQPTRLVVTPKTTK